MTHICAVCKIEKDITKFRRNKDNSIRGNDCTSCRSKKERAQLRLAFLSAYNSACSCCGEKDPRFLTLDHVNNDGNVHRKILKEHQIVRLAKAEDWPRNKYTCLCFNCNSGRAVNGGVCPHKCISVAEYLFKLTSCVYYMGKQFVKHNTLNLPEARLQLAKNRVSNVLVGLSPEQLEQVKKLLESSL